MNSERDLLKVHPHVGKVDKAEAIRDLLIERRTDSIHHARWADLAAIEVIDFWRDRAKSARAALIALIFASILAATVLFVRHAEPAPAPYQCETVTGSADILKCWPVDGTDELG